MKKENYYIEILESAKKDILETDSAPYISVKEIDEVIAYINRLELYKEYYNLMEDYQNTFDSEELLKLGDLLDEIERKIEEGL